MSRIITIACVVTTLYVSSVVVYAEAEPSFAEKICFLLSARTETEPSLTGTVHIYPKEFQEHDLLYFLVEIRNRNNEPVMGCKRFERGNFRTFLIQSGAFLRESSDFYYASSGSFLEVSRPYLKIESHESFVACNGFLEFPDYIVPQPYHKTSMARERSKQEDEAQNARFIKDYVGTGKKCKLGVALDRTGMFFSEPVIEIKKRSAQEIAIIKAWHVDFNNFLSETSRKPEHRTPEESDFPNTWKEAPSVQDYETFERQLSAGTLKNYIHFRKLLASIPDNIDIEDVCRDSDEYFKNLGNYLDSLHPIERGALIRDALWYFSERSSNGKKMKYLLLPKLPRSERARYFAATSEEDKKMFLELPEP